MRIVFDENMPVAVAQAIQPLVRADAQGSPEPFEMLHALDIVARGTDDASLVEAVVRGARGKVALITTDKSIRTRHYERAAFVGTGCIGIVLRGGWNHASLWDRAIYSLHWWRTWVQTVEAAAPGTLWQCPWSKKPKRLNSFD